MNSFTLICTGAHISWRATKESTRWDEQTIKRDERTTCPVRPCQNGPGISRLARRRQRFNAETQRFAACSSSLRFSAFLCVSALKMAWLRLRRLGSAAFVAFADVCSFTLYRSTKRVTAVTGLDKRTIANCSVSMLGMPWTRRFEAVRAPAPTRVRPGQAPEERHVSHPAPPCRPAGACGGLGWVRVLLNMPLLRSWRLRSSRRGLGSLMGVVPTLKSFPDRGQTAFGNGCTPSIPSGIGQECPRSCRIVACRRIT